MTTMRKTQSTKQQPPQINPEIQAQRNKLHTQHIQRCNESFEVSAYIMDLAIKNYEEIIYNKFIESKMDGFSIGKCLDSMTVAMEGGFIQHDCGEVLSTVKKSRQESSFEAQLSFENQQKQSIKRLQTLIEDKQSSVFQQQSLSNAIPSMKMVDDGIGGVFQLVQHNWIPNMEPDKDLKINPIMVEQDALIQQDDKVKMLRQWKLAQMRKAREEKRIKKERQLQEKKKQQAKRKLVELMKRQTITYDSKGGVIGVKQPKYSQFPTSNSGLQYDLDSLKKKKQKKSLRFLNRVQMQTQRKPTAETMRAVNEQSLKKKFQPPPYTNETSNDSDFHVRVMHNESQYIRDKMNYAGSNYQLLKPDYGVSIKQKGNVKQGSLNFKEKFGVLCRAEYEAQHAQNLVGKEFINTLAKQTQNFHLTQLQKSYPQNLTHQKAPIPMINQFSTIKEEQYATSKGEQHRFNKLQGSIRAEMNEFDHNSLRVDVQPPRFKLSSDRFTTLPKKTKAQLRREQRSRKKQSEFPTDAKLMTIKDDTQLPNFMRSTEARKGIGKSDKRALQTITYEEDTKKNKFLVKQADSPFVKPRIINTQAKKMLKQASQPKMGRTTIFFEAQAKLKNQKMLARQKGMNRDKTQPSLFAKNLIGSENIVGLKSSVNLPHLPQPPIGKSYGHGILKNTINTSNSQSSLPLRL